MKRKDTQWWYSLISHLRLSWLSQTDLSGRAMELGIYDITIRPRTAKKGQVLADFMTEYMALGMEKVGWDR